VPRVVLTGASTGIGHALALELSRRGYELALLARRGELLDALVAQLRTRAVAIPCDVLDAEAVRAAVQRGESELGGPFDLAIANAGVSVPVSAANFKLDDAERVLRVNVFGVLYLYDAVIRSMIERGSGRFVAIASIAGLRGLPGAAPYSASKAAVQTLMEAMRIELKAYGVGVTTVNPGFIATPMTEKNRFRMPFLMRADEAAVIIADGIESGKRVVEFPRTMSLLMRTARIIPDALYELITAPYTRRRIDAKKVKR
jgi:short-subunit dehydrogenase